MFNTLMIQYLSKYLRSSTYKFFFKLLSQKAKWKREKIYLKNGYCNWNANENVF